VLVEFSEPLPDARSFSVDLRPRNEGDGGAVKLGNVSRTLAKESPKESLEFSIVFPGRYLLNLAEVDPPDGPSLYGQVRDVVVRAGERTVVRVAIQR
jgi:hypothetical protein